MYLRAVESIWELSWMASADGDLWLASREEPGCSATTSRLQLALERLQQQLFALL